MADVLTKKQRSYNMSQIRSRDTRPEMAVRSIVHRMGYRFRLHARDLPGKPDIVLPRHEKIIFVHGCYWHMHRCRYGRVIPATNTEFWQNKRMGNVARDRKNLRKLRRDGWSVLVVWECWLRDPDKLVDRLSAFFGE